MNLAPKRPLFELIVQYETTTRLGEQHYYAQDEYNKLIDYYEFEWLYDEAVEVVNKAIELYPYTVEFLFRKAHIFILSEKPKRALKILKEAEVMVPGSFDLKLHKAWVLADLGKFNQSVEILYELQDTIFNKQDLSLVYYYESLVRERKGEMNKTYQTLKKAIELDPTNTVALEKMWWFMKNRNRLSYQKENINLFKKVVDHDPYSWWGWFNLGTCLEYRCRYKEAIEAYEFAIVIDESDSRAYHNCAEVCFNIKDYGRALRHFEEYTRKFNVDADVYFKIAVCYANLNKIPAAKKFLFMAIDENEFMEEAYFHLGECYQREGNFRNALLYYKKAANIFPLRDDIFRGIGTTYFKMGKPEHTRKYFNRMVELSHDNIDNWKTYIEFLYQMNELESALEMIDKASEYHSCSSLKYYKIAYQVVMGRVSQAFYYLEEALQEDFSSHRFLFEAEPRLSKMKEITDFINKFEREKLSVH